MSGLDRRASVSGRTVLVTGGAGYIGSHTCVALLDAGANVVVVDNLDNASPVALDRVRSIAGLGDQDLRFRFVQADLRDLDALRSAFDVVAVDAVIHFAGRKAVAESVAEPLRYYDHNLGGSINLVRAMTDAGVARMVFSSSCTVYGDPASVPVREDSPRSAINPYGRTKLFIEDLLADVATADPDWRVLLLRYFNPVGAHPSGQLGEDPDGIPNNLMPYIMQVAGGRLDRLRVFGDDYDTLDGTCIRDYIHVMDLAEAHVAALGALEDEAGCRALNVGTGTGSSVLDVVRAAGKAVGQAIPYEVVGRRPGDAPRIWADASTAEAVLGWRAVRDLDTMCEDHWRWQCRNPDGYPNPEGDPAG